MFINLNWEILELKVNRMVIGVSSLWDDNYKNKVDYSDKE